MSNAAVSDSLEEDVLVNGGERVIKLSLSRLAKNNLKFISVIQNMVVKNTKIAVRGSIIINYVVSSSIEQDITLPSNFCKRMYLKHVFNWALLPSKITNPHLRRAVKEIGNIPVSREDMPGKPWLLGYIESMYQGNIVTSIKGKWIALINDSITSVVQIHRVDKTHQVKDRTTHELCRMILTPACA